MKALVWTTLFFSNVAEHKMMNPSEEPVTVSNMTEREKEVCVFRIPLSIGVDLNKWTCNRIDAFIKNRYLLTD
ncbi:hypothetical protein PRIPAC_89549 [Pristionchus pacificus]|uniref:Uncharacterized protein n=1 Tax=Pristionchus pacificus TaxID=54126 RepID=A0A2A6CX36_PRIPA|nr:hypothetical protein PRIPAC_89549 [Pristionchus pacificus]|eukprot:PDM82591.1 hypothetical protein PRIPAC_36984 [Pristionchus pacificus]